MDNKIPYWIQKADYESLEFSKVTSVEAIEVFNSYDWHEEELLLKKLEEEGSDNCPYGMGIVSDSKGILHIMPDDQSNCAVYLHLKKSSKILSFINTTKYVDANFENVERGKIEYFIKTFYSDDYLSLLDYNA